MKHHNSSPDKDRRSAAAWVSDNSKAAIKWTERSVPPGLRLALGLLLIGGGFLGFLPILGFWMIPLGLAVAALDIRPLRQALKTHMVRQKR